MGLFEEKEKETAIKTIKQGRGFAVKEKRERLGLCVR